MDSRRIMLIFRQRGVRGSRGVDLGVIGTFVFCSNGGLGMFLRGGKEEDEGDEFVWS